MKILKTIAGISAYIIAGLCVVALCAFLGAVIGEWFLALLGLPPAGAFRH